MKYQKQYPYLLSLTRYKDADEVISALSDENFRTPFLRAVATAIKYRKNRKVRAWLCRAQYMASPQWLEKVALAMDDKGYMYDTVMLGQRKELYHEQCRRRVHNEQTALEKPSDKPTLMDIYTHLLMRRAEMRQH